MRINAELKQQDDKLIFEPFGHTGRLELNKKYSLDIKDYKSSRSLEQNAFMWKIIQSISKTTHNDDMDVYIGGLEHCNASSEFIAGLPQIEQSLKKVFRAVKIVGTTKLNQSDGLIYKCYIGSSKFDTAEMTKLVEYFIGLARELGIRLEKEND